MVHPNEFESDEDEDEDVGILSLYELGVMNATFPRTFVT